MNESFNISLSWPEAEPRFSLSAVLKQYLGLALALAMAFLPAGCLVDNEQFDEARRDRDKYLSELKARTEANNQLNLDLTRIYNDYSVLSTQLALTAALTMHDRYTEGLGRPRPAPPPPQVDRPARRPADGPARRPADGPA
ncbi:MAG: hypothetical protein LBP33_07130, partial [Candidatus Adiutrix sp.]|nr:hypothetical protein [Candidatus Adiutrix sp.]